MDDCSMSNNTILSNLYIVSNFQGTYDTVLVNVHVVTDAHFYVLETSLCLLIWWANNTFFSNDNVLTYGYLCEITSQHWSSLNNGFSFDHYFVRTFYQNLSANFVSFWCYEKPLFIIKKRMLLNHHFCN